jgi:hypothetical protein
LADRKTVEELEKLRIRTVTALQEHLLSSSPATDTGEEGAPAGAAALTEAEKQLYGRLRQGDAFAEFFQTALAPGQGGLEEGEARRLFEHLAGGRETLTDERLAEILRFRYSVVKPTVLTKSLQLTSKPLRRLEVSEVAMALDLPAKDAAGICRVHCKLLRDGVEGWATTIGNQGSTILAPSSHHYLCMREDNLTEELAVDGSQTVRKVVKGEILEALAQETEEPSSGALRVRCRLRRDGKTGWMSMSSKEGTVFLDPCYRSA